MLFPRFRVWVVVLLGLGVIALVICELMLRIWVPLYSIVDTNNLSPVAWYLEHADSLQARQRGSIHVSDERLGWTYAKNIRQAGLSTNSQGLRGQREYTLGRQPNILRGMVLGDSFSAGYGVADDETYATQLEAIISNSEFPNLAVPGYGVDQAVLRWEKIGRSFLPDVVILGIFLPDFHRNALPQWFDAPKPRFKVVNGALQLSAEPLPAIEDFEANQQRIRAELVDLLGMPRVWVATNYLLQRVAGKLRGWREPNETFEEKSQLLRLLIARLAEDCKTQGARLVLVNILTEYTEYPDEQRILDVINESGVENNVAVLTLYRFLGAPKANLDENPVFDAETGHWSAFGHRRAAELIARFLKEEGIAPELDI